MFAAHPSKGYLISLAKFFERGAYYGTRSIVVLFLIQKFDIPQEEALSMYGWMTALVYGFYLLAGPLVDFVLKPRWGSLLGGVIGSLGILCFVTEKQELLIPGGILFALGASFSSIGMVSGFGQLYQGRSQQLNAGASFFYLALNLGTFLGMTLITWLSGDSAFQIGFIVAIVMNLLSGAIAFTGIPRYSMSSTPQVKSRIKMGQSIGVLTLILLSSILFWQVFENIGGSLTLSFYSVFEEATVDDYFLLSGIALWIPLIVWFFLWTRLKLNDFLKLSLGLLLLSAALLLFSLYEAPYHPIGIILFTVIAESFAESLVIPAQITYYFKMTNIRFIGTVLGIFWFLSVLGNKLIYWYVAPRLEKFDSIIVFKFLSLFLLVFAIVFVLFRFIIKEPKDLPIEGNAEPELKEGELLD